MANHPTISLPCHTPALPLPTPCLSLLQFNFTNSRALNSRTLLFASYQSSATAPAEVGVVGCWMASGDWGRALGLSFPFNRPTALPLLLLLLLLMRFLSSLCMATYLSPSRWAEKSYSVSLQVINYDYKSISLVLMLELLLTLFHFDRTHRVTHRRNHWPLGCDERVDGALVTLIMATFTHGCRWSTSDYDDDNNNYGFWSLLSSLVGIKSDPFPSQLQMKSFRTKPGW